MLTLHLRQTGTLFRLPLSLLVAGGTVLSDMLPPWIIFASCAAALALATLLQLQLMGVAAGRTKAECDKFCYDSYIVKKSIIHTRKDSAFYQAKLVTVCQYGCDKRCNGLTNAKAVGCLARFTGGLEGACEAQSLRLLR